MLDTTPVSFSRSGNSDQIGCQAIGITAIGTIDFFEGRKVNKFMTIDLDISLAIDKIKTVESKANVMVNFGANIQNYQRKDHGVDKRGGE